MPRVLISAGEPSGDRIAADLVLELRGLRPDVEVRGVGGPRLEAAGVEILHRSEDFAVMGLIEILSSIPRHLSVLRRLDAELGRGGYDLVIPVDYPGFNLRLARAARRRGVPVLYYVAPQTWAWRTDRTKRIVNDINCLAVVLPFEEEYFKRHGVDARFVGHPAVDRGPAAPREEVLSRLGLEPGTRILALLPGSRRQEVERLWPVFRAVGRELVARVPGLVPVLCGAEGVEYPREEGIPLSRDTASVLAAADAALVKSGSATLEAALAGTPMVVAYAMHPLSFSLARRVVTLQRVSLVNILAGAAVVPELIQRLPVGEMVERLEELLAPGEVRERQLQAFREIRERLRGGAAESTARIALELISCTD